MAMVKAKGIRVFMVDTIENELGDEWLAWNSENPKPSPSESREVQMKWVKDSKKWLNDKYEEIIKKYDNKTWGETMAARIESSGLTTASDLDKYAQEYYTEVITKEIKGLKEATAPDGSLLTDALIKESAEDLVPLTQKFLQTNFFNNLMSTAGFGLFGDNPDTEYDERMNVVMDLIDGLGLSNVDYTDEVNTVLDSINNYNESIKIPDIEKNFKLFVNKDSVKAQGNAFMEGMNTLAGRPVTKGFYDYYIKNNVEVKTKMAQSFNISTEKLDEFVNNYLK